MPWPTLRTAASVIAPFAVRQAARAAAVADANADPTAALTDATARRAAACLLRGFFAVVIGFTQSLAPAHAADVPPATAIPMRAPHIVVDTGHTPQRPGATGASGRVEYQYNLDLSTALTRHLETAGMRVTRVSADGVEIALADRATRAPDANLFVSIHHDSMQQAWIDAGRRREFAGFSLFVSEKNPRYAQSLDCARAIGEQMLAAGETPSRYHATPIPGENRPFIDERLSIHRFDDLVVLKTATMPAVLVEAGVIANPDEEARLGQPQTIDRLAGALARGIRACQQP